MFTIQLLKNKLLVLVLAGSLFSCQSSSDNPPAAGASDREFTISVLQELADSVLVPLSEERLHEVIPRRDWETRESNIHTSALQAFGRTLSGMAPWLSLGADSSDEGKLRAHYIRLAQQCIANATNPESDDYMFAKSTQERIVHGCFLAYPLLLAPQQLWEPLPESVKVNVIEALKTHRAFIPNESNWLLFSALLESAIWKFTGGCDMKPIEYAITKHLDWYLGDGVYGDGPDFHWDYYNSYVIHPLLLEVLNTCKEMGSPLGDQLPECQRRGERYAVVLEHMISPEGTFPVIGRSSVYRYAVFHQLGYSSFRFRFPSELDPGATRAALTTVIRRMHTATGTFDENQWLNAGIVGKQLNARDEYNYTGALYMTAMGLMHLGLPPEHPFWTAPAAPWFQQRVWQGDEIQNMKPLKD